MSRQITIERCGSSCPWFIALDHLCEACGIQIPGRESSAPFPHFCPLPASPVRPSTDSATQPEIDFCGSCGTAVGVMSDARSPAPVAKVSLSRKVVDGMGEAAVMAARMGGVPGEPIQTILEAWGIEVTGESPAPVARVSRLDIIRWTEGAYTPHEIAARLRKLGVEVEET